MTDELKPCPFCGGRPNSWHHRSPFGISNICDVYCNRDDHNVVVTGNSLEEAIAAWNTRHEPDLKSIDNLSLMAESVRRGLAEVQSDELPEWLGIILHNKLLEQTHTPVHSYSSGFYTALTWVLSLRKPEAK